MSFTFCVRARVAHLRPPGRPSAQQLQTPCPTAPGVRQRPISTSTWQPVPQLESESIQDFKQRAFTPGKPVKLARGSVAGVDARGTWLTASTPATLNTAYLEQFASTLHLPMELSMPGREVEFHRVEAAPLSFFLDAWHAHKRDNDGHQQEPRFYIAQLPLNLLPQPLAAAFPTPDVVARAGTGDVYGSSLWLGRAPTATPLHRDPNPNVLVQVAGRKVVRLVDPQLGSRVYAGVREAQGVQEKASGGGFGADERIRGESMMKGREKELLEETVWGDKDGDGYSGNENRVGGGLLEGLTGRMDGQTYEVILDQGDALFIPLGWWHAVRGVGEGVNMSANWWFR